MLVSWVFFRAASLEQAMTVLGRIFGSLGMLPMLLGAYNWNGAFWTSLGLIGVLLLIELVDEFRSLWSWLGTRPVALRWGFYYALIASLLLIGKAWRPIPQIDRQRIAYLYPAELPRREFQRYLGELGALADLAAARGARLILAKPPTPPRYRDALPNEPEFDAALTAFAAGHCLAHRDFSTLLPEDANYYDTDHLNATGVAAFIDNGFAELLRTTRQHRKNPGLLRGRG